jgi:hypothetical protein
LGFDQRFGNSEGFEKTADGRNADPKLTEYIFERGEKWRRDKKREASSPN